MSNFLDIDYFKLQSSLADGLGIPSLNRFELTIEGFPGFLSAGGDRLSLQVLEANCPSFSLQEGSTLELNGIKRYYFMGRNDSELEITFLETAALGLRSFFYNWMQLAANVSENGVIRDYLENYVAEQCQIAPLDYQGNAYTGDVFLKLFPYDVNMINYSYGRHDILKTNVKFKYMFHHILPIGSFKGGSISGPGAGGGGSIDNFIVPSDTQLRSSHETKGINYYIPSDAQLSASHNSFRGGGSVEVDGGGSSYEYPG